MKPANFATVLLVAFLIVAGGRGGLPRDVDESQWA